MIYTNVEQHGGNFDDRVLKQISVADNATIASGYVSIDVIERYAPHFEDIVKRGGRARLLVGMAFYEGLSQKKLTRLLTLSSTLASQGNGSGVFIPFERKYHGKVYSFEENGKSEIFLGSSNFSASGLKGNMEATAPILDDSTKSSISSYINYLFSEETSRTIDQLDIVVPGSKGYKKRVSIESLDSLERFEPASISTEYLKYFDYDLTRIVNKTKSSLNVYFGRGRLSRASGKLTPRPWYEVALIAPASVIRSPVYPKGNFDAYTDDGYVIPMSANGDNNKNIQSRGSLKLFGMWIKSKLQNTGALVPLTPVTLDTLEAYGRSSIRFYKFAEGKYYVDFSTTNENSEFIYKNEDGEAN